MKETEFIELLNLYIDHEISAEDAARLEAEVVGSTEHRRIYRQYCRMHRACTLLAGQMREEAPETVAALTAPRRERSNRWTLPVYATGLMAAACFAVLVAVRSHRPAEAGALAVVAPSTPAATVAVAEPAPVAARPDLHPVVDLHDFSLASDNANNGLLTAEQNALFAWMKQVQVQPIQRPSAGQFNVPAVLLEPESRAGRSADSLGAPVEMAAFRFQR